MDVVDSAPRGALQLEANLVKIGTRRAKHSESNGSPETNVDENAIGTTCCEESEFASHLKGCGWGI